MRYFILIIVTITTCFLHANESLGKNLFAVHATDQFPINGFLYAGYGSPDTIPEGTPNVRRTLHFSIGELVRPIGTGEEQWMTWEDKLYAIVVPLESLFPQLVNLNCYDTFILGDLRLNEEMFVVAPRGTIANGKYNLYEYDPGTSLREAIDHVIASQNGWKVTMTAENEDEQYAPALVDGININTFEFFSPLLEQMPYLSLGLRWEPFHGEAWRFVELEMMTMALVYYPEHFQNRDELEEHILVLEETYLNAPQFSEISKETLLEIIKLVKQLQSKYTDYFSNIK